MEKEEWVKGKRCKDEDETIKTGRIEERERKILAEEGE